MRYRLEIIKDLGTYIIVTTGYGKTRHRYYFPSTYKVYFLLHTLKRYKGLEPGEQIRNTIQNKKTLHLGCLRICYLNLEGLLRFL
jgi:hypothetical protein